MDTSVSGNNVSAGLRKLRGPVLLLVMVRAEVMYRRSDKMAEIKMAEKILGRRD